MASSFFCGCVCVFSFFFLESWGRTTTQIPVWSRYALCYIHNYASKKQQENTVFHCRLRQLTHFGRKYSAPISNFRMTRENFYWLTSRYPDFLLRKKFGIGSNPVVCLTLNDIFGHVRWSLQTLLGQWIRASTTLLPDTRSSMYGATPRRTWRRFSTPWWTRKAPSCPPPYPWGWGSCQTPSSNPQNQSLTPDK